MIRVSDSSLRFAIDDLENAWTLYRQTSRKAEEFRVAREWLAAAAAYRGAAKLAQVVMEAHERVCRQLPGCPPFDSANLRSIIQHENDLADLAEARFWFERRMRIMTLGFVVVLVSIAAIAWAFV